MVAPMPRPCYFGSNATYLLGLGNLLNVELFTALLFAMHGVARYAGDVKYEKH